MTELGRLEAVELRKAWPSEPSDFTPWLAREENLTLLAKDLGVDLELIETESGVGPYRADILARRSGTEERVVIENQFGLTDHTHLGQLLTYASGVGADGAGARTIVWIAETSSEPHRATIDWLNKCTEPGIRFFGVQIELWRIGSSAFAPKFNIVCKPNNWQKQITQATNNPSEATARYLDFWTKFAEVCAAAKSPLRLAPAKPQYWLQSATGVSNFSINFTASARDRYAGCELFISGKRAKLFFAKLKEEETDVRSQIGDSAKFEPLPERQSCKVVETAPFEIRDLQSWPSMFEWLRERGETFLRTFADRARRLNAEVQEPENGTSTEADEEAH